MAIRHGVQLDLVWVHFNATHARFSQCLDNARARITARLPDTVMSVNFKLDGTQCLVKITAAPGFTLSLPAVARAAVIREFTEADQHEAVAMVTTVAWAGVSELD